MKKKKKKEKKNAAMRNKRANTRKEVEADLGGESGVFWGKLKSPFCRRASSESFTEWRKGWGTKERGNGCWSKLFHLFFFFF